MAGAEASVHRMVVEAPEIPSRLLKGSKFLKWNGDDSNTGLPITLRVDPKGFLIYWQEPNKDTECLEISNIRDTRYGKYAKEPKQDKLEKMVQNSGDPQLGKMVCNSNIALYEKCFTIVHGPKLVDLNFLNFVAVEVNPQAVVKEWADFLLKLAYHPTTRHISVQTSIEKGFTKLKLETNQFGEIPVRKLLKALGGRSKRVENALSSVGLISGKQKDQTIDPSEFQLAQFKKVLQLSCHRPEMDTVFSEIGTKRMFVPQNKFRDFVNTVQRDPKLLEILYPKKTDDQAMDLILNYEPNSMFAKKGQLTLEGLDAYLQSNDNHIIGIEKYAEHQDMGFPMSFYFINSSHNTYLTGNQYRSKSTAEMYRQVLLTGCRCVELDCWDGDDEPIINHGFTLCSPVLFREVIEAINECAFKTSPYPVVLSFENHVDNPQQQAKMAQYCRDIFGDKLLVDPIDGFYIEPGKPLPPPKKLMYKIIVKNKKQKTVVPASKSQEKEDAKELKHKRGSNASEIGVVASLASPSATNSPQRSLHSRTASSSAIVSPSKTPRPSARSQSASAGNPAKPVSPLSLTHPVSPVSPVNGLPPDGAKRKTTLKSLTLERDTILEEPTSEATDNSQIEEKKEIDQKQEVKKATVKENGEKGESVDKREDSAKEESEEKGENGEDEENEEGKEGEAKDSKTNTTIDEEDDDSEDEGSLSNLEFEENAKECGTALKESKAYGAMSALVNYVQPVRFKSFDQSKRRNRSHEISSFTETSAMRMLTYYPREFVSYNRRQTSRIYPKGARMDSSNYMPHVFWNAGCQFVALNYQVLDLPMQLNLGLFEFNGCTGYLLKPDIMKTIGRQFDPFSKTIDGVVATSISIKIISGQYLSTSKCSTYVEVETYGLPEDTNRKKFKTKTIDNNSINPHYDSPAFLFQNIILPQMATLRIAVMDNSSNLIGHRLFPIEGIRPGYRYITLRNEGNQPLTMPSLFIHLEVKDFVPEGLQKFSEWLANPIKYLSEKDKEEEVRQQRGKALRMLMDDEEFSKMDPVFPAGMESKADGPKKPIGNTPKRQNTEHVDRKPNQRPSPFSTPPVQQKPAVEKIDWEFFENFDPQNLVDIKLGKQYQKLAKEEEKKIYKMFKKHREDFGKCYKELFPSGRKSFFSVKRNMNSSTSSIDTNPALPEEAKKEELIKLLKEQFNEERRMQMEDVPNYIEKFGIVVKNNQEQERKKLKDISKKEEIAVQRQKDVEKEAKIKMIPVNLSPDQIRKLKEDITDNHIKLSVNIRSTLITKQSNRENTVKEQQDEIFGNLEQERKNMMEKIDREYQENVNNVNKIYEIRKSELTSNDTRRKSDPSNTLPSRKKLSLFKAKSMQERS